MSTMRCTHPSVMRRSALLCGLMLLLLLCPLYSFAGAAPMFFYGARVPLDSGFPQLATPGGIARDSSGNVYIVDKGGSQVLVVHADGSSSALTITGLGTPLSSPTGIAVGGTNSIYVADSGNNRIVILTPTDATTAAATVLDTGALTPSLNNPQAVAADRTGTVYIADTGNNRVVLAAAGNLTLLLSSSDGLISPHALALDQQGTLYIAHDGPEDCVLKWSQASGVSRVSTPWDSVMGLAVDSAGNLYVAGTATRTGIENATAGVAVLPAEQPRYLKPATDFKPAGLSVDELGNLYLTSATDSNKVFKLTGPTADFGHVQLGANSPVSYELFFGTMATTTLGSPTVYTEGLPDKDYTTGPPVPCDDSRGDFRTCSIRINFLPLGPGLRRGALVFPVVLDDGSPTRPFSVPLTGVGDAPVVGFAPGTISTVGTGDTQPALPLSMAFDGAGNLFVNESTPQGNKIRRVSARDGSATDLDLGSSYQNLWGLAFDALGNLYFVNKNDDSVGLVSADGSGALGSGNVPLPLGSDSLSRPSGVVVDQSGNIYVADTGNQRILKATPFSPSPGPTRLTWSQLSTGSITLVNPIGTSVDDAGNLYVADMGVDGDTGKVVKVTPSGDATLVSTGGYQLQHPTAVAVDRAGTLYIADITNFADRTIPSVIVKVSTTGDASLVDTGEYSLTLPVGLALDSTGNLYVADMASGSTAAGSRILKIDFASPRALTFADTDTGSTSTDSPKTVAIFNRGNQPLQFSVDPAFSNSTDFQQDTNDPNRCASGKVLQPGQTCGVSLMFNPQVGGTLSTNVSLKDNTLNQADSRQTIIATGKGIFKAIATIAGPATQPVQFTFGQPSMAVDITVSGVSGTPAPTGNLSFTLLSSGGAILRSGTASLNTGTANSSTSLQIPTYLSPGNYTFTLLYSGDDNYRASAAPITITVQLNRVTPAINWTQPSAITYGTNLSGALNATATGAVLIPAAQPTVPGGLSAHALSNPGVAGAFTYTATSTGGAAVAVTGATVLGAGSYTLTASFTPTDTSTYTSATSSVSLTVNKATPTVTLATNAAPVLVTQAVVLTATVASTAGTPSGTVGFYDGTTLLGTVASSNGTATFTTSSLAPATHSITATYSGDSNFNAVTSAAIAQLVQDFTLTPGSGTGGNGSTAGSTGSVPTQMIQPGGTATYNVFVGPTTGTTLAEPVTLSLTHNLPAGSTVFLSLSGTTTTGTTLVIAGGQPMPVIQLIAHLPVVMGAHNHLNPLNTMSFAFGFLLLPFGGRLREAVRGKRARRTGLWLLLGLISLASLIGLSGCGAVNSGYLTEKTYTITVTATSGSLSHSTNFNLVVR